MFPMIPRIDPEIARLAPGFCALSIVVEAAPVIDTLVGERALARACAALGSNQTKLHQLGFYVSTINHQMEQPQDNPTIGFYYHQKEN